MNNQQYIWQQVLNSYKSFSLALKEFFSKDIDRVDLMRKAIQGDDRLTAIYLLRYLPQNELIQLFPELVFLSSYSHGALDTIRQTILSLPRDWVLHNIEQIAEPILETGDYDEYRRMLELYNELNRDLTIRLAERAVRHEDSDIKEAGKDFLLKLKE